MYLLTLRGATPLSAAVAAGVRVRCQARLMRRAVNGWLPLVCSERLARAALCTLHLG